jgi:hypothetical protein
LGCPRDYAAARPIFALPLTKERQSDTETHTDTKRGEKGHQSFNETGSYCKISAQQDMSYPIHSHFPFPHSVTPYDTQLIGGMLSDDNPNPSFISTHRFNLNPSHNPNPMSTRRFNLNLSHNPNPNSMSTPRLNPNPKNYSDPNMSTDLAQFNP